MKAALRGMVRAHVPAAPRAALALARRRLSDGLSGDWRRLAIGGSETGDASPHRIVEVVQEIKRTAFFEGKLSNIRLGAARLDRVTVAPGEIFSFWRLIGRPSAAAGFLTGRSIRGGTVAGDVGGGLCQVSGIAYELGLRAGLDPVERFPHSRDLYAEAERFAALGLDATVVWPYKDLRMANRLGVPVTLRFRVDDVTLTASAHAVQPIAPMTLEIDRVDHDDHRDVVVARRSPAGVAAVVSRDRYTVAPVEL